MSFANQVILQTEKMLCVTQPMLLLNGVDRQPASPGTTRRPEHIQKTRSQRTILCVHPCTQLSPLSFCSSLEELPKAMPTGPFSMVVALNQMKKRQPVSSDRHKQNRSSRHRRGLKLSTTCSISNVCLSHHQWPLPHLSLLGTIHRIARK